MFTALQLVSFFGTTDVYEPNFSYLYISVFIWPNCVQHKDSPRTALNESFLQATKEHEKYNYGMTKRVNLHYIHEVLMLGLISNSGAKSDRFWIQTKFPFHFLKQVFHYKQQKYEKYVKLRHDKRSKFTLHTLGADVGAFFKFWWQIKQILNSDKMP